MLSAEDETVSPPAWLLFGGAAGVLKKKKGHSRCVEAQRWEGHSGPVSKFWRQGGIATKRAVTGLSHMPLSPVGLRRSRQRRAAYGLGSLPLVCSAFCRLVHLVIPSFSYASRSLFCFNIFVLENASTTQVTFYQSQWHSSTNMSLQLASWNDS